jgi:hypothetical protein
MADFLFYAKPEYILFQRLVRPQTPHAISFIPEHRTNHGTEGNDEQIFSRHQTYALHEQQQIR